MNETNATDMEAAIRGQFAGAPDHQYHKEAVDLWSHVFRESKDTPTPHISADAAVILFLRRFDKFIILFLCAFFCATSGCTIHQQTVVPRSIVSTQASFSGNVQNSGLIGPDGHGGFIVDANFIQRYDAMLAKYGDRFSPPIKTGDRRGITPHGENFDVTAEMIANFRDMNFWRKSEAGP